jgi:hypothetical protein
VAAKASDDVKTHGAHHFQSFPLAGERSLPNHL